MSRMQFKVFGGISPKITPRNLPTTAGQTAQNCWLAESKLGAIKDSLSVQSAGGALVVSIYPWRRGGSTEWLSFNSDTDVVQSPIYDDQYSRIYFTNGGTLGMKAWVSGAKVEVADVSKTAPAAPTATPGAMFRITSSVMRLEVSGRSATLTGYKIDGNVVQVKFKTSGYDSYALKAETSTTFRVRANFGGGAQYMPTLGSTDQDLVYSTEVPVVYGGSNIGTFMVRSITGLPQEGDIWSDADGTQYYGTEWTVTGDLNTGRSATQYQFYAATWIDAYGAESPASLPSAQVKWEPNEYIGVTAPSPSGAVKVRLYRSATGTSESNYYFLAEVDPGASYTDTKKDADLSEIMPMLENPPAVMYGLCSSPNGFLAGFNGKDIYFSEPWLPYSWPIKYRLTVNYDVIGIAFADNDLIITTKGSLYIASGTHPEIISLSKTTIEQSCVAKRSIAVRGNNVLYAAPDGLVSVSGASARLVTEGLYTRDQWQALTPSGMIAAIHDGRYIAFHAAGGIILDFADPNGPLTTTTKTISGLHSDLLNDQLYLIESGYITEWRAATTYLTATWKSKEFQVIRSQIWNSAMVIAGSYASLTLRLYYDGTLAGSYTVTSDRAFRLAKYVRAERWAIQIETTDDVYEVVMGSNMQTLRSGTREDPVQ